MGRGGGCDAGADSHWPPPARAMATIISSLKPLPRPYVLVVTQRVAQSAHCAAMAAASVSPLAARPSDSSMTRFKPVPATSAKAYGSRWKAAASKASRWRWSARGWRCR